MAGRNAYVSPEERAHMVALFRDDPAIDRVAKKTGWGVRVVKRVLMEEKAYDKERMIGGRNLEDSIRIEKEAKRLWRMGMAAEGILEELGIAEQTLKRIVKNVPRPFGPRFLRKPKSTIVSSPESLSWLAGVFDAAANIGIAQKRPEIAPGPYIRIIASPSFAALVHKVAGCGSIYHPKERPGRYNVRFQWEVRGLSDTLALLERVEPYLREQGPLVRRVIAKYGAQVEAMHQKEEPA